QELYYHTKTNLSTKIFLFFFVGGAAPYTPAKGMSPLEPQLQKHKNASAISGIQVSFIFPVS
ncbi:MAG: hypothetical protein J6L66_05130, partial [Anaerotignum sp.]|nr:hypothetical protein [Anaerotignum sp.]